ncbi:MAG: hypothetical protein K8T89_18650 [Planctomycetes bacterium]|nr:hypothetical protein [Planctomycetota bacterium]
MTIPAESRDLGRWLDEQIAGRHLRAVVEELAAVHRSAPAPAGTFEELLGDVFVEIMERGLAAIPHHRLIALLKQPDLLLTLQEAVLSEGGPYWDKVAASDEDLTLLTANGRRRLEKDVEPAMPARPAAPIWRHPFVVSFATAAVVLIAVFAINRRAPGPTPDKTEVAKKPDESPAPGWGWNKPDALPNNLAAPDYLAKLGVAVTEWSDRRPENAVDLSKRLNEFRQGCSMLLLATHQPLPADEKTWLKNRCRDWAKKINTHLADLEAGTDPIRVRVEVDETVRDIAAALRSRAENLRG